VALLRILIDRAGAPVSKDALMEAAWPGLTVEDSNLTVQIAALRRALGEVSGGESWIATLPRRGYRFVGPAVTVVEAPPSPPSPPAPGMSSEAPQMLLGPLQPAGMIPAHRLGAWAAAAALVLGAAWWLTYVAGWSATGPAAPAQLEKPQAGGQFDGTWRVEFSHNEHCMDRRPFTTHWMIRQGMLVTGKTRGAVSGAGELRGTIPAVTDPTLSKVVSAKLQGGRGEGEWIGLNGCAGAVTFTRASGPDN
jgi:hypothetical protein